MRGDALGQQVLVDPKPGANTIVGSEIVARYTAGRRSVAFS